MKREEQEKRLQRAQKFGLVTNEVLEHKRMERAVKFGVVVEDPTNTTH